MHNEQSGSILITTILFTLVLTALVLTVLQKNTLESKMATYFNNKNLALANAEIILRSKEQDLLKGKIPREARLLSDNLVCATKFYLLTITSTVGKSQVMVQSTIAVVGDVLKCDPKPMVTEGRESWAQIN